MANQYIKKPTLSTDYIQSLIKEREKRLKESFHKAKSYLDSIKFSEKTIDQKIEFLNSRDGLLLVEGMYADKLAIIQIAYCLEITQNEFYDIMRENPRVFDAIERGRARDIDEVEEAIQKAAKGFYVDINEETKFYNERTDRESSQTKVKQLYYPPNVYAATYILNNKRAKEYKDRQIEEEIAKNTIKIELELIGDNTLNLE